MRVANYQDKAISLEVKKTVSGDIKLTDPQAKDITLARGLKSINPTHEFNLADRIKTAGESGDNVYLFSVD